MQRLSGLFVGAVFGTIFVYFSATAPLSPPLGILLRVLAVASLAGIAAIWLLGLKVTQSGGTLEAAGGLHGRRHALIVAAEVVLLLIGLTLLRNGGVPEQVNVAWLAFMAGTHVIVLAAIRRERGLLIPGTTLVVIGLAGFALVTTAVEWVPVVSGVPAGTTILAASAAYAWRTLTSMREPLERQTSA